MKRITMLFFTILLVCSLIVLISGGAEARPVEEKNPVGYTVKNRKEMEPWEERIEDYIDRAAEGKEEPMESAPVLTYYGNCRITHYCPCKQCCGKCDGITASGVPAVEGVTVAACSGLPFGTQVSINGCTYTVQDRGGGISDYRFDIFVNDHQRALELGLYYTDVYIVG